ncbi:peptide deformylase [Candidatus Roizmanbacteria bacterium]|nr:peptide deformylase [Candidatus Roizmanbacteria bacterium]
MKKQNGVFLQIAQLGHPVLREKAQEVKNVDDPRLQSLIDDLIATVMDADGVGIAAPQVYQPIRLFIIASHPNPRYPNAPTMKPTAVINPTIIYRSKDKKKDWEGCLSVPGIRALVPRHKVVKVRYSTRTGKSIEREFTDFVARIFQHEYDHLEGVIFLDRLTSSKDIISEK